MPGQGPWPAYVGQPADRGDAWLWSTIMPPKRFKIVSGGQTGADRAALDWALRNKIPHGGWCPKGRRAEDGPIPPRYELSETPTARYIQRTEWNVRDSDATVIFSIDSVLTGGPRKTLEFTRKYKKPWLVLANSVSEEGDPVLRLKGFIRRHHVHTLNVAGPRASREPAVGDWVLAVLDAWLFGVPNP
jgi:hypothetical protein